MNDNNALLLPIVNDDDVRTKYFLFGDTNDHSIDVLPNYSKINILVGANNSGKSRFMRYLMKNKFDVLIKNQLELKNLINKHNNVITLLGANWCEWNKYNGRKGKSITLERLSKLYSISYQNNIKVLQQNLEYVNELILRLNGNPLIHRRQIQNTLEEPDKELLLTLLNIIDNLKKYINYKIDINSENQKNIYIPTLRSAHSLYDINQNRIQDNIFHSSINKHHNLEKVNSLEIFTGIDLYDEILEVRNSRSSIRKNFEKFEKFVSNNFFNGKPIDIVANLPKRDSEDEGEKVITIFFEGDEDRKLHELGDGIQALIILMYKIYMAKKDSIIYIDEPELHLHPGMQRLFLEQLSKNKFLLDKNLTYFIATHSNHLLDISIEQNDISIYTFSATKDSDKKIIKNVNNGDNEALRELGVNNTSVFMSNCAIWVEGVSDRNYLKAFLQAYCNEKNKKMPLEDLDFAFFEYAGSNIEHYIFEKQMDSSFENKVNAFALNNKIFLLADSDNAKKNTIKGKRLLEIEGLKTDSFFPKVIWNYREIENLLPNTVWEKVLIEFRNKAKYLIDEEDKIQDKISKGLKVLNSSDFKKNYIGEFLNKLVVENKISELNKTYEERENKIGEIKYGTFLKKKELSRIVLDKVIKKEIKWSDFNTNTEIVELTEELYKFISPQ